MSSDSVLGLLRRPRTPSSASCCAGRREATALVRGAEASRSGGTKAPSKRASTPVGGGGLDPLEEGVDTPRRGVGGGPLSTQGRAGGARLFSFLPARDVETGARASTASCQ